MERSLKRSRHRRRIAEINRRSRRRRKGTSVAVTAAMAAGPVLPTATAVADSGSVAGSANQIDPGAHDALSGSARHVVLRYGSTGRLVAAAQMRLNAVVPVHHLAVDGIYGPLTRAAVEDFQARHSLGASGAIDTRTWADMFNAPVLALASGDSGSGSKAGDSVEVSTSVGARGQAAPAADVRGRYRASAGGSRVGRCRDAPDGELWLNGFVERLERRRQRAGRGRHSGEADEPVGRLCALQRGGAPAAPRVPHGRIRRPGRRLCGAGRNPAVRHG